MPDKNLLNEPEYLLILTDSPSLVKSATFLYHKFMSETSSFHTLLKALRQDFPALRFRQGERFTFRPPRTIFYNPLLPSADLLIFHEIGHALCGHCDYQTHIRRLEIEAEAWAKGKEVIDSHPNYQVTYNPDFAEDQLDTYRDWLHQKSLCPTCHLTRCQTPDGKYHCPHCELL